MEPQMSALRRRIFRDHPTQEQLERGTIYWHRFKVDRHKGKRRLLVAVRCGECGEIRWHRPSIVECGLRDGFYKGTCRKCYNSRGSVRFEARFRKMLASKPAVEERSDGFIHWHAVHSDLVNFKHTIKIVCKRCGKERWIQWKSMRNLQGSHRGVRAICRACTVKESLGPNRHWSWKGGRRKTKEGYITLWIPKDDPLWGAMGTSGGCYMMEHRVVMARELGRPLKTWEHVHHLNGQKDDNRPENLELVGAKTHRVITKLDERITQLESLLTQHGIPLPPWPHRKLQGKQNPSDTSPDLDASREQ